METEPISVRIARIKGCEPLFVEGGTYNNLPHWRCSCRGSGHAPDQGAATLSAGRFEAWLQPAAIFALLAEMVEGPFQDDEEPIDGADVAIGKHGKLGYWFAANDGLNNQKASQLAHVDRASTLGEAIALAWIDWKGARQ